MNKNKVKSKKKFITLLILLIILIILLFISIYIKRNNLPNSHMYNIYFSNTTLPTLYESMDIIENKNKSSYIWLARSDTIDLKELKKINPNMNISDYMGEQSEVDILSNVIPEIEEFITNTLEKDKNAKFTLYVDDFYYWIEFPIFVENNISEDLYNVILYTDGTMSYEYEYEIMKENSYETFLQELNQYKYVTEKVRSGKEEKLNRWNFLHSYLENSNSNDEIKNEYIDYNYIWTSTFRENTKYFLQYPDILNFRDENVKKQIKSANIIKLTPKDKFEKLSDSEKEILYKLIKFDKKYFDTVLKKNEKEEVLIITGTNPFYGDYSKEEFENIIEQTLKYYGDGYKLLYKPHPKAIPSKEQEEYLNKHNIEVLPASLPMEVISFVYSNINLGGFESSLYMSFERENTKFLFAKSSEDLVEPLNKLFENYKDDIKFIQPIK